MFCLKIHRDDRETDSVVWITDLLQSEINKLTLLSVNILNMPSLPLEYTIFSTLRSINTIYSMQMSGNYISAGGQRMFSPKGNEVRAEPCLPGLPLRWTNKPLSLSSFQNNDKVMLCANKIQEKECFFVLLLLNLLENCSRNTCTIATGKYKSGGWESGRQVWESRWLPCGNGNAQAGVGEERIKNGMYDAFNSQASIMDAQECATVKLNLCTLYVQTGPAM